MGRGMRVGAISRESERPSVADTRKRKWPYTELVFGSGGPRPADTSSYSLTEHLGSRSSITPTLHCHICHGRTVHALNGTHPRGRTGGVAKNAGKSKHVTKQEQTNRNTIQTMVRVEELLLLFAQKHLAPMWDST